MVMVSKLSNFPDELSENDELREFEISGSDCIWLLSLSRGIDLIVLKAFMMALSVLELSPNDQSITCYFSNNNLRSYI